MSWRKERLLPYSLVVILLIIHIYAVIFDVNSWPVSGYPMFARRRLVEDVGALRIEAILKNNEIVRIPLFSQTIMSQILMHWTMKDPHVFETVKKNFAADFASPGERPVQENVWRNKYHMVQDFRRDLAFLVNLSEVKEFKVLHMGAHRDEQGHFKEQVDEEYILVP